MGKRALLHKIYVSAEYAALAHEWNEGLRPRGVHRGAAPAVIRSRGFPGLIGLCSVAGANEGLVGERSASTPSCLKAAQTRPYQTPMFAADAHGSAGSFFSPFWMSSIEMLSGVRMKAMWPSRGGRLMVTPAFWSLAQSA
jgi:hypothetical protein